MENNANDVYNGQDDLGNVDNTDMNRNDVNEDTAGPESDTDSDITTTQGSEAEKAENLSGTTNLTIGQLKQEGDPEGRA